MTSREICFAQTPGQRFISVRAICWSKRANIAGTVVTFRPTVQSGQKTVSTAKVHETSSSYDTLTYCIRRFQMIVFQQLAYRTDSQPWLFEHTARVCTRKGKKSSSAVVYGSGCTHRAFIYLDDLQFIHIRIFTAYNIQHSWWYSHYVELTKLGLRHNVKIISFSHPPHSWLNFEMLGICI